MNYKEYIKESIFNKYIKEYKEIEINKADALDIFDIIYNDLPDRVTDYIDNNNSDRLYLRINSPGGDAFSAMAAINLLKSDGRPITTELLGMAASCAADLFLIGDERIAHRMGSVLIHNSWMPIAGNSSELRKMADQLDDLDNQFIEDIYMKRLNMSKEAIISLLKEDRFMTKDEMKKYGVYTVIKENKDNIENNKKTGNNTDKLKKRFKVNPKLRNILMEV